MAWYQNNTRFGAIVTLRIIDAGGQDDALKMGIESNLKKIAPKMGIYDFYVGPEEMIEITPGINAEFIAVRSSP